MEPERYLDTANAELGDIMEVFGWYEKQEWVKVKLVKKVSRQGYWQRFLVERV